MNYYGRFYRSAMEPLLLRVNTYFEALGWEEVPEAADPQGLRGLVDGVG
jgi:hypothetical protein